MARHRACEGQGREKRKSGENGGKGSSEGKAMIRSLRGVVL